MELIIKWSCILVISAIGGHFALKNGLDDFIAFSQSSLKEQEVASTDSNRFDIIPESDVSVEEAPARAIRLKAGRGGHFYLNARINGASIPFVVDTGASLIALSHEAAQQAGIRLKKSDYKHSASTANGKVPMAVVMLDEVRYKGIRAKNVRAGILPKGALNGTNLLGNSFLSQLQEYTIKGETLIMIP